MGRVSGWARLVAVVVAMAMVGSGCSSGHKEDPPPGFDPAWVEPVFPGGPATMADICAAACTGDLVILPDLRATESTVDLPMPDTAGA